METSALKSMRISYLLAKSYPLSNASGVSWLWQVTRTMWACTSVHLQLYTSPHPLPRKLSLEPPSLFLRKTSCETVFPQACVFSQSSLLYFCQSLTPLCNLWYPTVGSLYLCYSMKCEEFIVFQEIMFLPSWVFVFIKTEGESPAAGEDEK